MPETISRPIGYYVHHHGDGHRQRALAIAAHAAGRITLLGTGLQGKTGRVDCIDLPDDRMAERQVDGHGFDGKDGEQRPSVLHYAPIDHEGVRQRTSLISNWIREARPALMIVDVSVETAMLARLASVPIVYVRLNGRRDDLPHRDAFLAAKALLAPFHADLDDEDVAPFIRRKTFYAAGLGARTAPAPAEADLVLGVAGRGNGQWSGEDWATAARATPELRWHVIGPCTAPADPPANLRFLGWVDDAPERIARATVVVGAAGDGLVGSVLAARRPFICIPEDRPFDEQRVKGRRLACAGAALCLDHWPSASDWPELIEQAGRLLPEKMAHLDEAEGSRRAAEWLISIADGPSSLHQGRVGA